MADVSVELPKSEFVTEIRCCFCGENINYEEFTFYEIKDISKGANKQVSIEGIRNSELAIQGNTYMCGDESCFTSLRDFLE